MIYTSPQADLRVLDSWHALASGARITALPVAVENAPEGIAFGRQPRVGAGEWARAEGARRGRAWRLPTVAEYEELHAAAVHIDPVTLPTRAMTIAAGHIPGTAGEASWAHREMMSAAWCAIHDREVVERLERASRSGACANAGKHWYENEGAEAFDALNAGGEVGWWLAKPRADGRTRIQNPGVAHEPERARYCDYAMTFHVVDVGELGAGAPAPKPVRTEGPAPACKAALRDANEAWPGRSKKSDGIMGDARHQASKSDHNLGNAVDVTHDKAGGCDADAIAELAITDPRTQYVIRSGKIYNVDRAAEGWRKYTGSNPHKTHVHISIKEDAREDASPWPWAMPALDVAAELERLGFADVKAFQAAHPPLVVDGIAGPKTKAALRAELE